ncbi:MAG: DUF296 domain-containing protein [Candidatus Thermoplasmatota archaeon]|nr:DUF296 domain-containing protein [Candidatus Thermoplasmatota archaeon]MBU1940851.1 DUF296 domain-containing protein [Candidatus Thermoplasmatota archaeon]
MHYKTIGSKTIVRLDPDEELIEKLTSLCNSLKIKTGSITGIGATNNVTIGIYNTTTKTYQSKTLTGDHEITALIGNITSMNNTPYLHLHITLCDSKNQAVSGHLSKAVISVTFEGIIDHIEDTITRKKDPITGLNLLELK